MPNPTAIVNPAGDSAEAILHYAKYLGTEVVRRNVFDCVYGRGQKPRSKKQIMQAASISEEKSQQVQNALDHLSRHHLISKVENDGSVTDRSRWLYGKLETIRAHRDRIKRYADDPKAAAKVPTKRNAPVATREIIREVSRTQLKKRKKIVVLYMYANPDPGPDTSKHIRPEAEVRLVQEEIRSSKFRDNIDIQVRPAADLKTVLNGLNDFSPDIVHFSGHSNKSLMAVDSGAVVGPAKKSLSYDLFANALAATDKSPRVVVLNSCLSASARSKILGAVEAMVGMSDTISDGAAAAFAQQFYAAIASGQSLHSAFQQGVVAVEASSLSEKSTPKLFVRNGLDSSTITLV